MMHYRCRRCDLAKNSYTRHAASHRLQMRRCACRTLLSSAADGRSRWVWTPARRRGSFCRTSKPPRGRVQFGARQGPPGQFGFGDCPANTSCDHCPLRPPRIAARSRSAVSTADGTWEPCFMWSGWSVLCGHEALDSGDTERRSAPALVRVTILARLLPTLLRHSRRTQRRRGPRLPCGSSDAGRLMQAGWPRC